MTAWLVRAGRRGERPGLEQALAVIGWQELPSLGEVADRDTLVGVIRVGALALIHQVSRGLPRAVNNLALQSLVAAYSANKAIVDECAARPQ